MEHQNFQPWDCKEEASAKSARKTIYQWDNYNKLNPLSFRQPGVKASNLERSKLARRSLEENAAAGLGELGVAVVGVEVLEHILVAANEQLGTVDGKLDAFPCQVSSIDVVQRPGRQLRRLASRQVEQASKAVDAARD